MLHGLRTRERSFVSGPGFASGRVAIGMLIVGGWFFEALFRTGEPPVDLGDGWPVIVIAIGTVLVLVGLFGGPDGDEDAAGIVMSQLLDGGSASAGCR